MEKLAVTLQEARDATSIGNTTLYKLINEGRLTTVKIGRRTLITADSLRALFGAA